MVASVKSVGKRNGFARLRLTKPGSNEGHDTIIKKFNVPGGVAKKSLDP